MYVPFVHALLVQSTQDNDIHRFLDVSTLWPKLCVYWVKRTTTIPCAEHWEYKECLTLFLIYTYVQLEYNHYSKYPVQNTGNVNSVSPYS